MRTLSMCRTTSMANLFFWRSSPVYSYNAFILWKKKKVRYWTQENVYWINNKRNVRDHISLHYIFGIVCVEAKGIKLYWYMTIDYPSNNVYIQHLWCVDASVRSRNTTRITCLLSNYVIPSWWTKAVDSNICHII